MTSNDQKQRCYQKDAPNRSAQLFDAPKRSAQLFDAPLNTHLVTRVTKLILHNQ